MKSAATASLAECEALQEYSPASDSINTPRSSTEVTIVPLEETSTLAAGRPTGDPSFNQVMVGRGIPDAEHKNVADSVMFTVVSSGELSMARSSGRGKNGV